MNEAVALPPRLAEIVEDFKLSEGREKLELLLQYAESLPPLPDWLEGKEDRMEEVPECMTPISVTAEMMDGKMTFYFSAPVESPTVRGYAAILAEGLNGSTPEEVLNLPTEFFTQMGLEGVLSGQRLRGFAGLVAHIKRLAVKKLG